jgi:hypothetical protein
VNPEEQIDPLTAAQGDQAVERDDLIYEGSTFREVRDALCAAPRYYDVWPGPGSWPLPDYPLTLGTLLRRCLRPRAYPFGQAAQRTVDSRADLRWGPDRKGVRRLLHPNGVCLTGTWEITEATDYTGYFRLGSKGLVIARYSVGGCPRRGRPRSLALVGKIYPTTDPESPNRVCPAGFITQEDFGGSGVEYINDAELRNAPDTHAWRRGLAVFAMLTVTGLVFDMTDTNPTFRQLYEIAELGKPAAERTRAPEFLRLLVDADQPRIVGDGLDFRDEILGQIYDGGDQTPRRRLVFHIETSDTGLTRGPAFFQRRVVSDWKRVGRLVFNEAVASYNGDFVVHFHHPGWRTDRNDPSSAVRQAGKRVR